MRAPFSHVLVPHRVVPLCHGRLGAVVVAVAAQDHVGVDVRELGVGLRGEVKMLF